MIYMTVGMYTSLPHDSLCNHVPRLKKKMSCSTHLSMKSTMLITVKMPTIVGILTVISMINTTSESLKARKVDLYF